MAKSKKFGYVEPDDYFPPEIRKMFENGGADQPADEKQNPYREQSKKMIDEQRKKKSAKKS